METAVVVMTVNRASATSVKRELLPVLWVQLKSVYSLSWCRLVLIRERKHKLIIFIHTKAIDESIVIIIIITIIIIIKIIIIIIIIISPRP